MPAEIAMHTEGTSTVDTQALRTYGIARGWKLFLTIAAGVLVPVCGAGVLRPLSEPERPGLWLLSLLSVLMGGLMVMAALAVWRSHVVLRGDTIELIEFGTGRRALRRADIQGIRREQYQYANVIVLVPRYRGMKPMKLMSLYDFDPAFQAWIGALPDLDTEDTARAIQDIRASPELGGSEEERLRRWQQARSISRASQVLSIAMMVWVLLYPRPLWAAILVAALMPLVALQLQFSGRGLYRLDVRKNDPQPTLVFPLMVPGLVLTLRSMLDTHLLEWPVAIMCGVVGTAVFGTLVWLSDRHLREQGWKMLIILPLLFPYPYGLVVNVNSAFDSSEPRMIPAEVMGKSISHGKSTTYHLQLAPWGPKQETTDVTVSSATYDRVGRGGHVQVWLRQGFLGMPWYTVRAESR